MGIKNEILLFLKIIFSITNVIKQINQICKIKNNKVYFNLVFITFYCLIKRSTI